MKIRVYRLMNATAAIAGYTAGALSVSALEQKNVEWLKELILSHDFSALNYINSLICCGTVFLLFLFGLSATGFITILPFVALRLYLTGMFGLVVASMSESPIVSLLLLLPSSLSSLFIFSVSGGHALRFSISMLKKTGIIAEPHEQYVNPGEVITAKDYLTNGLLLTLSGFLQVLYHMLIIPFIRG